eukprot:gene41326-50438_t
MADFDSPRTSLSGHSDDVLLSSGLFEITLLSGSLVVFSVPHANIPKCAWWLVREFCMRRNQCSFSSLVGDEEGLSVVCNSSLFSTLQLLIQPQDVVRCENFWRAVVIEMSSQADELPNAVYTLANSLSSKGVSILHISTFESEVFLIQEKDLAVACEILKAFELPTYHSDNHHHRYSTPPPYPTYPADNMYGSSSSEDKLDMSWIAAPTKRPCMDGRKLCVLPTPLVLGRIKFQEEEGEEGWGEVGRLLTYLLLFNEHFLPLEKKCRQIEEQSENSSSTPSSSPRTRSFSLTAPTAPIPTPSCMWGIWQQGEEVTLL